MSRESAVTALETGCSRSAFVAERCKAETRWIDPVSATSVNSVTAAIADAFRLPLEGQEFTP